MSRINLEEASALAIRELQSGRIQQGESILREIHAAAPADAALTRYLGVIALQAGRSDLAIELMRRAVELAPGEAGFHNDLGVALERGGHLDQAAASYQQVLSLRGEDGNALKALAKITWQRGQRDDAVALWQRAYRAAPQNAEICSNLGAAAQLCGQLDTAIQWYERALTLAPNFAGGWANLGAAYSELGQPRRAVESHARAMELDPASLPAHSNFLLSMSYLEESTPEALFREHQQFGRRFPAAQRDFRSRAVKSDRRLRIGFISGDFWQHAVSFFIEPLLTHYDRSRFHVTCYADVAYPDATTQRLRGLVDSWQSVIGWPHERVAELILRDQVDVLVELAGHSANNRLAVLALRPAPVQVSYLGYPNTTGLTSVDYKIVDARTDPPGESERFYTERLARLAAGAWCFQTPAGSPQVADPPCLASGHVTFGSFIGAQKISDGVIAAWSRVLRAVPNASLQLKAHAFQSHAGQAIMLERFSRQGIQADRIQLLPPIRSYLGHLAAYGGIDIALDTFPYNGTTTTCEAIWMGVPVVTIAGGRPMTRVGRSLLETLGLGQWVARDIENYIAAAVGLAQDAKQLQQWRQQLRRRMQTSSVMDGPAFARDFERLLGEMWASWKARHSG